MATSTSYSRTLQENHQHRLAMRSKQMSFLAQAKPAIISQQADSLAPPARLSSAPGAAQECELKSERLNENPLRLPTELVAGNRSHLIEDESLIDKQNASNQMRQAAVMSAVASQQSKRLSATERLALGAKRPSNGHSHAPPPPPLPLHQNQSQKQTQPTRPTLQPKPQLCSKAHIATTSATQSSKTMPTLETLLAVQRQLQRHTRQNLTQNLHDRTLQSELKPTADESASHNSNTSEHKQQFPNLTKVSPARQEQNAYAPLPQQSNLNHGCNSSKNCQQQQTKPAPTYDKELPPLPASISPDSTPSYGASSDESQLNSLESPATSLVSLPPPPPPISSYLQQYEGGAHASRSPTVSTSSATSSSPSDFGSVISRHFPVVPLKQQAKEQASQQPPQMTTRPPPVSQQQHYEFTPPPPLPPPPPPPAVSCNDPNGYTQVQSTFMPPPPPLEAAPASEQEAFDEPDCAPFRFPTPPPPELMLDHYDPQEQDSFGGKNNDDEDLIDQQDEAQLEQLKKKLMAMTVAAQQAAGATLRHAPKGQDSSESSSDSDSDFQCRIPTPPLQTHKSASFAPFQGLACQPGASFGLATRVGAADSEAHVKDMLANQQRQFNYGPRAQQAHARAHFNASSFSPADASDALHFPLAPQVETQAQTQAQTQAPPPLPISSNFSLVQPPPLFRQAQNSSGAANRAAPQLTVRVNSDDDDGAAATPRRPLISSAAAHLALVASSSSPSSSSDGDGHSTNSSSSTSGVHSSIDSPPSSHLKLERHAAKQQLEFKYPQLLASRKLASSQSGPAATNLKDYLIQAPEQQRQACYQFQQTGLAQARRNSNSSLNSIASTATSGNGSVTSSSAAARAPRLPAKPALKQRKSVSFSDKIELVACADERQEEHLLNPLLARVLAAKKQ